MVFITDFQQADLIITTFELPAEECYETPQIIIDPLLTSNDLLLIDQWIEKIIMKESDLLLSMSDFLLKFRDVRYFQPLVAFL